MNAGDYNLISFFWLLLIAFLVALIARRIKAPYALALVITGLLIGVPRLLPKVHLDPNILMTVFLPPLLFESALNLRVDLLKRDWKPITLYTLLGTLTSTFIVGGVTAWALHIPPAAGLVFGALISTTDPISVIAIFKRLGAGKRLTLIMEAESLFNNDTAVVLFTVMMGLVSGGRVSYTGAIGQFFQLVVGGAFLGIAIGALASRVHYELDDHLIEITLTTVVAFGAYLIADKIGVSGVMAVVTAGITLGNYGMQTSMSPGTRLAIAAFWEYAAFVVNSIVFLLIGIEVAYVDWTHRVWLALGAALAVLVGRSAIYPISLLVNRLKGDVPRSWQHVLVWGGLRGALSMALVLGLPLRFPERDSLVAATFGVVLFSLLVQGSTVGPLLHRLGLTVAPTQDSQEQRRLTGELMAVYAALAELARLRAMEAHPDWSIQLLTQNYEARRQTLEETLERIAPGFHLLSALQATRAQEAALVAQKNAFMEAERLGVLEAEDWRQIGAQIDAELLALKVKDRMNERES